MDMNKLQKLKNKIQGMTNNIEVTEEENIIPEKENINMEENEINKIEENNNAEENVDNLKVEEDNDYKYLKKSKCDGKNDCRLTKRELCTEITNHYMVRINIIVAILSIIPYQNDFGEYSGFCFDRINSLEKGELCLPPGGTIELKKLDKDKLINKLGKYINYFTKSSCESNRGYFKIVTDKEKDLLKKSNGVFTQKYKENFMKLKTEYLSDLNILLGILKELYNVEILNNKTLSLISKKTRDILSSMYKKCEIQHLRSILSFLYAELDMIENNESILNFVDNEKN